MIINAHFRKLLCNVKSISRSTISPAHVFSYIEKHPSLKLLFISSARYISSTVADDQPHSFVVSYLVNNCGLSAKAALSASKHVKFETPDKPDSALSFFKSYGFSTAQISRIIRVRPALLSADPEKTLSPKIDLLRSKGFSDDDLVKILTLCPVILHTSVEKSLIPSFRVLWDLFLSNEIMVYAIKRHPRILIPDRQVPLIHNIELLKENGVPQSRILWLLKYQPRVFVVKSYQFVKIIEEIKGMGINPSSNNFVVAIHGLRSMRQSTLDLKFNAFKKWGWSKEEALVAFGKHPWCLMTSEKKITKMMDYYINKMGWHSSFVAKYPVLLSLSLEMRVMPRCSILKVLLSKGLITIASARPLLISEKLFLSKFVTAFKEELPHLLKLYENKLNDANRKEKERRD